MFGKRNSNVCCKRANFNNSSQYASHKFTVSWLVYGRSFHSIFSSALVVLISVERCIELKFIPFLLRFLSVND